MTSENSQGGGGIPSRLHDGGDAAGSPARIDEDPHGGCTSSGFHSSSVSDTSSSSTSSVISSSNIEDLDHDCAFRERHGAKEAGSGNISAEVNSSRLEKHKTKDDEIIELALSDFKTHTEHQLQLTKGDKVKVLNKANSDWWWAELNGKEGYVPVSYLACSLAINIERRKWQDNDYFDSYANLRLHHEMLEDSVRTSAYLEAVESNANWMKGKVVLDIGCGTGILSMFCAKQGGAAKVYGVEASNMASYATKLVQHNNLEDSITIIHGKAEEIELPEQVDLIVSEWMGTLLIFELMIESVIVARDKWLLAHGVMWPSNAKLFLVPCKANVAYNKKIDFWRSVYGFDFTPLIPVAKDQFFSRPIFNHLIDGGDLLADTAVILEFDMNKVKVHELENNTCNFRFVIKKSGTFHGFGSWFAVDFSPQDDQAQDIVLDTGPDKPTTHWKQDMFMMNDPCKVQEGDMIEGAVTIARNPDWRRHLRVTFNFTIHYKVSGFQQDYEKLFLLWR